MVRNASEDSVDASSVMIVAGVGWRWGGRSMRAKYCDSWVGEYVGLEDLGGCIVGSMALVLALLLGAAISVISVDVQCLAWLVYGVGQRRERGSWPLFFSPFLFFLFRFSSGILQWGKAHDGVCMEPYFSEEGGGVVQRARSNLATVPIEEGAVVHHGSSRFDEETHLHW